MKIITYSKIGYNAPSQSNWCYGIWKIDIIDTKYGYCHGFVVKENFGGDSRFKAGIEDRTKVKIFRTRGVYTDTGTPKITGIRSMEYMDGDDFIKKVVNLIK